MGIFKIINNLFNSSKKSYNSKIVKEYESNPGIAKYINMVTDSTNELARKLGVNLDELNVDDLYLKMKNEGPSNKEIWELHTKQKEIEEKQKIQNINYDYKIINDIDGNKYKTIQIGTQKWMIENLKTTHYRNGKEIACINDNIKWKEISTGAYCDYNNVQNYGKHEGYLYNWHTIIDKQNICPKGCHIPNNKEWKKLMDFFNNVDYSNSVEYLEIVFSIFMEYSVENIFRDNNGFFSNNRIQNQERNWWSTTEVDVTKSYIANFDSNSVFKSKLLKQSPKINGYHIRCLVN